MSLWHKRTPSGSVSLCLNCNRYPGYSGKAARKNFSRGSAPKQKPETMLSQRTAGGIGGKAGAECPAVSMETSVTLQRMLSMLSRLNSEGRNKSDGLV